MFTYTPAQAAAAADCPLPVLSRWLDNSVILLRDGDIDTPGQGSPRRFGPRRVLQIALARALHNIGLVPSRAAAAALLWTDQGAAGLEPAGVFASGDTYLAIDETGGRIVHADPDASLTRVTEGSGGWQPGAAVLVDLRRLRERVLDRLAEHAARAPTREKE